jgi:outer membrane protein insertion porin family
MSLFIKNYEAFMKSLPFSPITDSLRGSRKPAMFLTALLCCAPLVSMGQVDFEGKNITNVEIRYLGKKTVDEAAIRGYLSTRAGQAYNTEKLDSDIKKLYESGKVDDVRWLAEPVGNGVKLIAEVTTRPPLDSVGFVGNSIFSDGKLAKESKLKAGGPLSDEQILTARRNIEAYYQGYGYPDVSVTHRMQPGEGGGASLIFLIDEGMKNEVRKIRFEGNNNISAPDLKKVMKTKQKSIFSIITKSGRVEGNQLDEDLEEILDYYRNKGYLRVSSSGIQRVPTGDGKMDLVIPINEGARYTVQGAGFGTMTVFKPEELYPALTLVSGDAYSSKKMRADIEQIRSYYGSRGYADATVVPDIRNASNNTVQITYRITEGSRNRVGRVNITGNTKSKDKVIRREVPLKPGDWFNSVDVDTTRTRLKNLNYFNDAQVSAVPGSGGYRDLNILVDEKKTGSLSFGVGFSNIDSIVGYVNVEQTNFDLLNPWNFTGGGQRFSASLRAGQQRRDFSMSLVEPWFLDRKLSLGGEVFYRNALFFSDFYNQTNIGAAIFLRQPLGEKAYLKGEYRFENIELDIEDGPNATYFQALDDSYLRSSFALNYVYDSRDSNQIPREGHKVDLGINYAGLGGDVNTVTFSAAGQKYWNLAWDSILSVTGEVGMVDSTDDDDVPIFDRQYLGGPRTLRGFEFRDVGPRDATSKEVIGGNSMGWLSVEYTVPLFEQVRGAVFYDAGFVNEDSFDFSPGDYYSDYGVGLRLNLPFGPLAFDYALPVEAPDAEADKGGQFNFYLDYKF